jgi:hypothetical protein
MNGDERLIEKVKSGEEINNKKIEKDTKMGVKTRQWDRRRRTTFWMDGRPATVTGLRAKNRARSHLDT